MRFVHGMEMSIFGALLGAANATGRRRQPEPKVRVIRQTSRQSLDRLIAALKNEQSRVDALEADNAELRRRLAAANRSTVQLLRQSHGS